jgi:hypothetical protein
MAASWIEEAKEEEVEFFENASDEEIDQALRLANYGEYQEEDYASLSDFPKAQRMRTYSTKGTRDATRKGGWKPLCGSQPSKLTDEAADDYTYAMAA